MRHVTETITLLATSSFYYTIAIGMDSNYTYVSPNYDMNFGLTTDTLVGKPFHITLHPDDVKICGDVAAACFEAPGQLLSATLRKHDGAGGYIFTQWEMKATFDDSGNPEGVFCIGYNITEYVTTQTKLVHANTEIENKTDQLHQIGLLQSHGVRRPLANVIGLANILGTMTIDTGLLEITDKLLQSAAELDDVIRNIVDKTTN